MEAELKEATTPIEDMNLRDRPRDPTAEDPDNVRVESGIGEISDRGATGGVGLPEVASEVEFEIEDPGDREVEFIPTDMRDIGDPNGGDVGVPGGLSAGGEMGEGGRDHDPRKGDAWGSDIQPPIGDAEDAEIDREDMGGTGAPENSTAREDRLMEDEDEEAKR